VNAGCRCIAAGGHATEGGDRAASRGAGAAWFQDGCRSAFDAAGLGPIADV
jgi:hypothetical protein